MGTQAGRVPAAALEGRGDRARRGRCTLGGAARHIPAREAARPVVAAGQQKAAGPAGALSLGGVCGVSRAKKRRALRTPCPQALRLGNFINETQPIKVFHQGSDDASGEQPKEPKDPLVLRLGNYLSGSKEAPTSAGPPPVEPPPPSAAAEEVVPVPAAAPAPPVPPPATFEPAAATPPAAA